MEKGRTVNTFKFVVLIPFAIVVIAFIALSKINTSGKADTLPQENPANELSGQSGKPTENDAPTVEVNGITYSYAYFSIQNPTQLSLLANFSEKLLSTDLATSHNCETYINGNFYDTEGKPLGLWRSGSIVRNIASENRTFNGFLSMSTSDIPSITFEEPLSPKIAVQTGPMLISEAQTLPLRIQNDEPARRMTAVLGEDRMLHFLTVFQKNATYSGPTLTDLPEIVQAIGKTHQWHITEAINLDGGSASAFSDSSIVLQELTPVGSIFCVSP